MLFGITSKCQGALLHLQPIVLPSPCRLVKHKAMEKKKKKGVFCMVPCVFISEVPATEFKEQKLTGGLTFMEMGAVLVAPFLKPDIWMFGVRISFFWL